MSGAETTSAILRNVYRSPYEVTLQRRAPDLYLLFGEIRITNLEIGEMVRDEGAFVALIAAQLESTVDGMVEFLRTPTFPGHDLPWEGDEAA